LSTSTRQTEQIDINQTQLVAVLTAKEFYPGKIRIPFQLMTRESDPIENANVMATITTINQTPAFTINNINAKYLAIIEQDSSNPIALAGFQGLYVLDDVDIPSEGYWEATLEIELPTQKDTQYAQLAFEVVDTTNAPRPGDAAIPATNPTFKTLEGLARISTHPTPNPSFYKMTITRALEEPKPLVLVFATPGYCTTRMCGPVLDVVEAIHRKHPHSTNFIHVEPFDLDTVRREGKLSWVEAARMWNLSTEPWVFVIKDKLVLSRFEGLFAEAELEDKLTSALTTPQ
tara:strand:+ start:462 stop:1325 length:864 start_codon:yes stop_codon:yes gene_type:complete